MKGGMGCQGLASLRPKQALDESGCRLKADGDEVDFTKLAAPRSPEETLTEYTIRPASKHLISGVAPANQTKQRAQTKSS